MELFCVYKKTAGLRPARIPFLRQPLCAEKWKGGGGGGKSHQLLELFLCLGSKALNERLSINWGCGKLSLGLSPNLIVLHSSTAACFHKIIFLNYFSTHSLFKTVTISPSFLKKCNDTLGFHSQKKDSQSNVLSSGFTKGGFLSACSNKTLYMGL